MKTSYAIIYLFLLIVFISCGTFNPQNKFNFYNGSTFYNDSLNITVDFFGDTKVDNPEAEQKKLIKSAINGLKVLKIKDLLVYGTCFDPEYELFLFFKEATNPKDHSSETVKLVLKDTIRNRILYKKHKQNKVIYLLLKSANNNLKPILRDGLDLIENLAFDSTKSGKLNYSKIFETYKNNSNHLFVSEKLKNALIPKSKQNDWEQFQYLATVNSFMSSNNVHDSLINKFETSRKKYLKPILDSLIEAQKTISDIAVFDTISEASKRTNVVMLNEMHWKPTHRIMAQKLLNILKKNGYNFLAVEALNSNRDSLLELRSFPIKSDGYYTNEPYFGLFIREAKKIGFTIIAYDDFDTKNREETQAINLKEIIYKDPDAKIFVYAGIAHILESETTSGKKMATYFKELTNINPLTINQVDIVYDTNTSLILTKSDNFYGKKKINTSVDYFLINNLTATLDQVYDKKELKKISLQKPFFNNYINKDLLISVYYQKEYEIYKSNAVPILNRITHLESNTVTIDVPISKGVIKIMDMDDNIILIENINF